jgi:hypothetical protein
MGSWEHLVRAFAISVLRYGGEAGGIQ